MSEENKGIIPLGEENLPDLYKEYGEAGRDDVEVGGMPILHVCQPLSPEVVETGIAKAGDLVARPAGKNLGRELVVAIPLVRREWIKWIPRNEGGGIEWRALDGKLTEGQREETKWGPNRTPPAATETIQAFVVEVDPETGGLDPHGLGGLMLPYSKGSMKVGKELVTLRKHFDGPPIFAIFKLEVQKHENDLGTWFVAHPKGLGALGNPDSIQAVAKMHEQLKQLD